MRTTTGFCLSIILGVAALTGCSPESPVPAPPTSVSSRANHVKLGREAYEAAESLAARYGRAKPEVREVYQQAVRHFTTGIEAGSGGAETYAWRGRTHLRLGAFEDAARDVEYALTLEPQLSHALATRARLHFELGRVAESLADFDRALQLDPADVFALNNRGIALNKLGRSNDAEADYRKAVARDTKYYKAHFNLGNVYRDRQDDAAAIAAYSRAIEINPEFTDAWTNRGNAYGRSEQFALAYSDYDRALSLTPQDAKLYFVRALARQNCGQQEPAPPDSQISGADQAQAEAALADLDAALKLDPSLTDARRFRAILGLCERYDDALHEVEAYLQAEPEDAEMRALRASLLAERGRALLLIGRLPEALSAINEALGRDPTNAELLELRGSIRMLQAFDLYQAGRLPEALSAIDDAIRGDPDNATLAELRGLIQTLLAPKQDRRPEPRRLPAVGPAETAGP